MQRRCAQPGSPHPCWAILSSSRFASLGDPDLEAQLGRCCFPGPVLTPAAFQPPLGSQNIPSRPEFSALRHVCSSVCHPPCCFCLSILGDQESWWWLYPSPVWSKAASGRCSFGRRYLLRLPERGWGFMCCLLGTKTSRFQIRGTANINIHMAVTALCSLEEGPGF